MRHTAHGDTYAHDAQELILLLIQEAGCEPADVHHLSILIVNKHGTFLTKPYAAAIIEDSSDEYVMYVEADSEEEVKKILNEAGIKAEKRED